MKKIGVIFLILALLLSGCGDGGREPDNNNNDYDNSNVGNNNKESDTNDGDNSSDRKDKPEEYVFEINGTKIAMNGEMAPILDKLGEPLEYFEAASCAFQGMEKIYTYNSYEIITYENGGKDCVLSVLLLDDTVSTKEGVYLYSSFEDIIEVYGDEYNEGFGLYEYENGDSRLTFFIENNVVTSIEYTAITED